MAQIIPHRHRRISYGPTLEKYVQEGTCRICSRYPSWREHLAAFLRLLANRLDGGVSSIRAVRSVLAPEVAVRIISTGAVFEVEPERPVVLLRDVFEGDRDPVLLGPVEDFLTRTDVATWRDVAGCLPAYVLDGHVADVWLLCELPDVVGRADERTLQPNEFGEIEVSFFEEEGGA